MMSRTRGGDTQRGVSFAPQGGSPMLPPLTLDFTLSDSALSSFPLSHAAFEFGRLEGTPSLPDLIDTHLALPGDARWGEGQHALVDASRSASTSFASSKSRRSSSSPQTWQPSTRTPPPIPLYTRHRTSPRTTTPSPALVSQSPRSKSATALLSPTRHSPPAGLFLFPLTTAVERQAQAAAEAHVSSSGPGEGGGVQVCRVPSGGECRPAFPTPTIRARFAPITNCTKHAVCVMRAQLRCVAVWCAWLAWR